MATLTQLTLDADGTIGSTIEHDAGTGSPFYTHCNDAPDGVSSDNVRNDSSGTTDTAWFSLSNVNSDFDSMDTLDIDVDGVSTGFAPGVSCDITARIFNADNDTSTPLTNESGTLLSGSDGFRVQRNVSFSGLTGSKSDWDAAHIRFTWTYSGSSGVKVSLHGCDIDGTYTATTPSSDKSATNMMIAHP